MPSINKSNSIQVSNSFNLSRQLLIPCIIPIIFLNPTFAGEETCDKINDQGLDKLELILEKCKSHNISDDDCMNLFSELEHLDTKDIDAHFAKSVGLSSPPENPKPPTHSQTQSSSNQIDYDNLPRSPSKAFAILKKFAANVESAGKNEIKLHKKLDEPFETLKPAEIKNAFKLIDTMKKAGNKSELESLLKDHKLEHLGETKNFRCAGSGVISVHVSQGARMCFRYESINPLVISILCIGFGRVCYDH